MFLEAFASLATGPMVAFLAAKRSQAQKVSFDVAAEQEVLFIAQKRPDLTAVAVGAGMTADSFTDPARARRWQEAASFAEQEGFCVLTEETAAEFEPVDDDGKRFVASGETVLAAHLDRESYQGSLKVVRTNDYENPLAFEKRPVSWKRALFAVLWSFLGFLVASYATSEVFPMLSLSALVLYGLAVTLIDFDTLFLDYRTFAVGTIVSWSFATASLLSGQLESSAFYLGLSAALFWVVAMKLSAFIFRRLRGVDGLGGGDLLIVVVTTGIPVAITGSLVLAAHAMTATGILAIMFVATRSLFFKRSYREAFALGPFLAAGWMVALPILTALEAL